jgi:curved DNA-binding protein CbpA
MTATCVVNYQAYFAQAKKYHPDQNQGSDDAKKQFQKVTEVSLCIVVIHCH